MSEDLLAFLTAEREEEEEGEVEEEEEVRRLFPHPFDALI